MNASIFVRLASIGAKYALKKLLASPDRGPLEDAIDQTVSATPDIEGVAESLKRFIESEWFGRVASGSHEADDTFSDEEVVNRFIQTSEFGYGDPKTTSQVAAEVLRAFLDNLDAALMRSSEGTRISDSRNERRHKETIGHIELLSSAVADIATSVSSQGDDSSEQLVHSQIDAAARLMEKRQFVTARELLDGLGAVSASDRALRFRIETNLGVCASGLGDEAEAVRHFEQALALEPEGRIANINGSVAALMANQPETALSRSQKAIQVSGAADPDTACAHLRVLHECGRADELSRFIAENPWIREHRKSAMQLASLLAESGDSSGALEVCEALVEREPENSAVLVLLAQTMFQKAQEALEEGKQPLRSELRNVVDVADRALQSFEYRDSPEWVTALTAKAGALLLLGRVGEAQRALETLLDSSPSDPIALRNMGLLAFRQDDFERALEFFSQINEEHQQGVLVLKAACLEELERTSEVLEVLASEWKRVIQTDDDPSVVAIANLLLSAYRQEGREQEVRQTIEDLQTIGSRWKANLILAGHLAQTGDTTEAISVLEDSVENWPERSTHHRTLLADLYAREERFQDAADVLEPVIEAEEPTAATERYAIALFNSGRRNYATALAVCRGIRETHGVLPVFGEIEALICEDSRLLSTASEIRRKLYEQDPSRLSDLVQAALNDFRSGDRQRAVHVVQEISLAQARQHPSVLLDLARLRSWLELKDALRFAYEAARRYPADEETQVTYAVLVVASPSGMEELSTPSRVEPGCSIRLEDRSGESTWYTVLESGEKPLSEKDLPIDGETARLLIDQTIGAQVVLGGTPLDVQSHTIVELKSRYLHYLHQLLEDFATRFPNSNTLQVAELPTSDRLIVLGALLPDAEASLDTLITAYRTNDLPMATVAQMLNKEPLDVWGALAAHRDGLIKASPPAARAPDELPKTVVVDITALVTLALTNSWQLVESWFDRILLAQSVADLLRRQMLQMRLGTPVAYLHRRGSQARLTEATGAEHTNRRQFLEQLVALAEASELSGVEPIKQLDHPLSEDAQHALGRTAVDSIMLAQQQDTLLLVDDLPLRAIATDILDVQSVGTVELLQRARDLGQLSQEEHWDQQLTLLCHNYRHIDVDSEFFTWAARRSNNVLSWELGRIVKQLDGRGSPVQWAAREGARFLRELILSPVRSAEHDRLITFVVNSLFDYRNFGEMKPILIQRLEEELRLLPYALHDLRTRIEVVAPN